MGAADTPGTRSPDGRQRQVSRAVRGSRREAEKALAAFYAEVDAPAAPASKGTVGELLEACLDQVSDDLSPKTVHEYRRLIQVRIRPGLGDRPVKLSLGELPRARRRPRRPGRRRPRRRGRLGSAGLGKEPCP
ncbi:MAG: hypothetical protein AVDCRST_MAG76-2400 [uncultured Acidimicrobiales bacterium]|uniref:Core-binding (CB) domain-containing protein n=1 Tax=uncultured Acidimicrobiales bacterium TaxID=310071 RepID=A0A6J4IL48_9ACTN|nr:MAG: hypothetical protein AVDCRST_MAG76-2400 [uncultured Acidimicrobiales bacterium]